MVITVGDVGRPPGPSGDGDKIDKWDKAAIDGERWNGSEASLALPSIQLVSDKSRIIIVGVTVFKAGLTGRSGGLAVGLPHFIAILAMLSFFAVVANARSRVLSSSRVSSVASLAISEIPTFICAY
jgi:hypothetical protein